MVLYWHVSGPRDREDLTGLKDSEPEGPGDEGDLSGRASANDKTWGA